MHNFYKMIYAM